MKTLKFITILSLISVVLPLAALAATSASLSPSSVNVQPGASFNVAVNINPQGVKNYTVKLVVKYPADLLEVTGFSFGDKWMPLSQSGYDLVDNQQGKLIKTAGYPGGIANNVFFGTIVFKAKKEGSGNITVDGETAAFDQSNQDVFAGSSQVAVSVSLPKRTSTPAATSQGESVIEATVGDDETASVSDEENAEVAEEDGEGWISLAALGSLVRNKYVLAILGLAAVSLIWSVRRRLLK